jgi:hypothetical protein
MIGEEELLRLYRMGIVLPAPVSLEALDQIFRDESPFEVHVPFKKIGTPISKHSHDLVLLLSSEDSIRVKTLDRQMRCSENETVLPVPLTWETREELEREHMLFVRIPPPIAHAAGSVWCFLGHILLILYESEKQYNAIVEAYRKVSHNVQGIIMQAAGGAMFVGDNYPEGQE